MPHLRTVALAVIALAGLSLSAPPGLAADSPHGTWPWWKQPWYPFYYFHYSVRHGAVDSHYGRTWKYLDGHHHGFPYTCSPYQPRAAGASFNFGTWLPRRSYYHPYQPGVPAMPYGYSPEPYYFPPPEPAARIQANEIPPKGSFTPF